MATPSHVDLSVLWVPIMPETSKFDDTMAPAMEKAGKDAKDKFQQATKDIGKPITEELEKAGTKTQDKFKDTGEKISETFRKSGKDSADNFSDELARGSSKFDGIATTLGKNVGAKLGEALHGGIGGALDKLEGVTKTIGVDISEWTTPLKDAASPLQDIQTGAGDIKTKIQDWTTDIESLPGKLGKVGTAIGELAGPISVVAASWAAAIKVRPPDSGPDWNKRDDGSVDPWKLAAGPVGTWLETQYNKFRGNIPHKDDSTKPDYSDMLLGDHPGGDQASSNFKPGGDPSRWGGTLGASSDAYDFFSSGASLPRPDFPKGDSWFAGPSSTADTPGSLKPRNVGSNQGLTATSKNVKQVISTLFPEISDIGGWRPPDGYNEHSSGQALDVMIPNWNTPQGQQLGTQIKDYVLAHAKELGVDYALWQQNQWNPGGTHSAMENRGDPNQNHFTHVHVHTVKGGGTDSPSDVLASSGGGRAGRSSGGQPSPLGTQHDPLYTTAVDSEGKTQNNSDDPNAKDLGSGFLDGIMQSVGLDGSVFKSFGGASNPMDFGITKLGTGLLNWGMGMAQQRASGGGDGSILPGLGSLIPHAAAQAAPAGGNTTIIHGDVNSGFQVTQNGVQGDGTQGFGEAYNSKVGSGRATAAPLPNASFGPSAGMP